MQAGDQQAEAARRLWRGAYHGVLSSHSVEHPGYPFGSLAPFVIDQDGLPLLLLSHLSQHTRNVDADPRCGLLLVGGDDGDVQQQARLSAVGELQPCDTAADAERYFRYFPPGRVYHAELGFRFYRFAPLRFHWNGGFATARWFGNERIVIRNPLSPEVQSRIIDHMNRDHPAALARYLGAAPDPAPRHTPQMVGIDAEGIDLRVADRLHRVHFSRPIQSPEEARAALVEMANG